MSQAQVASQKEGSVPVSLILTVAACTVLGLLGILTGCTGIIATGAGLFSGPSLTADPVQAQLIEDARANQAWWILPGSVLYLLSKMVLAAGLTTGGILTLGQRQLGPRVLRPVLVYGVVFELTAFAYRVVANILNWPTIVDQYDKQMAATPGMDASVADTMSTVFAVTIFVTLTFSFLWTLFKVVTYLTTTAVLRSESSRDYIESWQE